MIRSFLCTTVFALISIASFAQDSQSVLSNTIVLYGDDGVPPAFLDSSRGWVSIGAINWDQLNIGSEAEIQQRRWRLRSSYEHQRTGGPVAIQVRIRDNSADPVFTHPWSESADRSAESYSNWYENAAGPMGVSGASIIEVRLIAPPRTPLTGKLYGITMETWDSPSDSPIYQPGKDYSEVQLAHAQALVPSPKRKNTDNSNQASPKEAMDFSLSFVESCLNGDLAAYYRSQADELISLDDGSLMARYRQAPPKGISGLNSIDEYKSQFDYKIYDSKTYSQLFPEWFGESRNWTPDQNSFLFMGHQNRNGTLSSDEIKSLIFLVSKNTEGQWKVVARPGK